MSRSHTTIDQCTTVVDVTYSCNATCKYCQFSNSKNPLKKHLPLREILLSAQTIKALGTKRIVLSGGEPRLHPNLSQILSYYRKLVNSVVIITNGYGLDWQEISNLTGQGATGVTVSLDSSYPNESLLTRETPADRHQEIISNLRDIGKHKREFEFAINSVVSHTTANWKNVRQLLEFGHMLNVDFVKFQPIFDDGYVGLNAPHLMLTPSDSYELLRISGLLETIDHPLTNPPGFWKNIADLAIRKTLSPTSCNLGQKRSIAVRNSLGICYWLKSTSYGNVTSVVDTEEVQRLNRNFNNAKLECKVDFHCFCTQNLSHIWKKQGPGNNGFK